MHTLALVRALVDASYDACVCAYFEYEPAMVSEVERLGARVRLLRLRRRTGARNLASFPSLALGLRRAFAEEKPDIVHVQYLAPGAFPVLCARTFRAKKVIAALHTPGHVYRRRVVTLRWIAEHLCDAFICVSTEAEKGIFGAAAVFERGAALPGRRHWTIFNGVDACSAGRLAAEGSAARNAEGAQPGEIVVGVVGRLNAVKGHATLLDAYALVAKVFPAARLLIVGDGDERSALEAQARRLGIAGRVSWRGRVGRTEALRSYGSMDIVVVPSRFEGFGLSAVEAMAAGRPVVASDVDGLRDVIDDGVSGLLVPEGDPAAMAHAILRLATDPPLAARLAACAKRRARERFDIGEFQERWLNLYAAMTEAPA